MSVRSNISMVGRFIRRKIGLGSYLAADVAASGNPTSIRVLNPELFDPMGGTLYWVSGTTDKFFTYTGVNGDQLVGIPASGVGEIDADMYGYGNASNTPTLVYRMGVDDEELERAIDRYKLYAVEELLMDPSQDGKHWRTLLGFWANDVQVRDDNDDTFNVITLGGSDLINYETGEVFFNTPRSENRLYLAGDTVNPYLTIADLIDSMGSDDRFLNYAQVGQSAHTKADARELAKYWRGRGFAMSFCRRLSC